MKEELENTFGKEYEQVQDKLVELAAVYGDLLVEKIGGCWEFNSARESTYINKVTLQGRVFVLGNFVQYWSRKDMDSVEKSYRDLVSTISRWINALKVNNGEKWYKYIDKQTFSLQKCTYYKPTAVMHKRFYEEHEVLTKKFMERYGLEGLEEESILPLLKEELEKIFGKEYEQVQDKLVELAAVYGELIVAKVGGAWNLSDCCELTYLDKILVGEEKFVLDDLVIWWSWKDAAILEWDYHYFVKRVTFLRGLRERNNQCRGRDENI